MYNGIDVIVNQDTSDNSTGKVILQKCENPICIILYTIQMTCQLEFRKLVAPLFTNFEN